MAPAPPIGSTAFAALAAGVRGQLQARTLRDVLDAAGALDPTLAPALVALDAQGRALAEAGATALVRETVGTLIDVIG